MELPNDLHVCMPDSSLISSFVTGLYENNRQMSPVVALGSAIPFLQYELNSRGFQVELGGGRQLPFSIMSLVVAPSGTGKSTTWHKLNELRAAATELTRSPHEPYVHEGEVGLDGSTAGVGDEMVGLYDEALNISPALLYADEMSRTFASIHGRGSKSQDLPQFLNTVLMGTTSKTSLRKKNSKGDGGSRVVVNPRVSGCGYTVLAALREGILTDEMASTGFLARLLVLAVADDQAQMSTFAWDRKPFDPEVWNSCVQNYMAWLNRLDLWKANEDYVFTTDEGAQSTFRTLHEYCNEEFVQSSEALRSYLNRAVDKAAFIGALYASFRGSRVIETVDAEPAMNVVLESFSSLRGVVEDADIGNATDDYERKANKHHEAALKALAIMGEEGLSPAQFVAANRPKKLRGRGVGSVGTNKREVLQVLENFIESLDDGEPPVTYLEPEQWRAYRAAATGTPPPGRPSGRYFLTAKLPPRLKLFLEGEFAAAGNVTGLKEGEVYKRHMERWDELGWKRVSRKLWKKAMQEAQEAPDACFERDGERRKWPFASGWDKKAQDARD